MPSCRDIPEEILEEILCRLPAKSIGQFRSVSKTWRTLLSHPQFIKAHLNQHQTNNDKQTIIILISNHSHSLYSFNFYDTANPYIATKLSFKNHQCAEVMGSCDGLLLLVRDMEDKYVIINPTTREFKSIPSSPFALDPRASFTACGFGCDSRHDDYKVVTLCDYDTNTEHEPDCTEMLVHVYSLNSGRWKRVESSPYDHTVDPFIPGVFVGGCIHWLARKITDYSSVIAAFDLEKEKFREVPPPGSVNAEKFVFNQLVVLGGCLAMVASHDTGTDVWMMKEYGVVESWTKFTISDYNRSEFNPFLFLGNEEIVLEMDGEKLVAYNVKDEILRNIEVRGIILDYGFQVGGTFIENLVSPN